MSAVLSVPASVAAEFEPDDGGIDFSPAYGAAVAYAAAGWYVGPVRRGSKNPGSVLGGRWQHKTSRDPGPIESWFTETDHGVFLHVGRSGAIVADVDHPERLHPLLRRAIEETSAPHQSTREDTPGRGHYLFAQPSGRRLGNGLGELAGDGWGELRGLNGVIIVAPSEHERAAHGGRYRWASTGPVPVLPDYCADLLTDVDEATDAATDEQVAAFRVAHTTAHSPELLAKPLEDFTAKVADGRSRHDTAVRVAAWLMRDAADGLYAAEVAEDDLRRLFLDAVGDDRGTAAQARSEYGGIIAWAVAQAVDGAGARLDAIRAHLDGLDGAAPYCIAMSNQIGAVLETRDWRVRLPKIVDTLVWLALTKGCPGLPRVLDDLRTLVAQRLGDDPADGGDAVAEQATRLVDAALAGHGVAKRLHTAANREAPSPCTHGIPAGIYQEPSQDPRERAQVLGVALGPVGDLRAQLIEQVRDYAHMPDLDPLLASLGTAVTAAEPDGAPACWLQIVAASSTGKTDTVELFADVRAGSLAEISVAGLLSWSRGRNPRPVGLLAGVHHGLVTFADFSGLLASGDRNARDKVYALLRDVYDGRASRTVQAPGVGGDAALTWQGRLTVLSAVTHDIDTQHAHNAALGERWIYVRPAPMSARDQRLAARKTRDRGPDAKATARDTATRLVLSAQARLDTVKVTETLHEQIENAALVSAWGRTPVRRSNSGAQEIIDVPQTEGIGRLATQLTALARGLLALDLDEDEVVRVVRRVALDSMPARRLRVLHALATWPRGPLPEAADPAPVDASGIPDDGIAVPHSSKRLWGSTEDGWLVSRLARVLRIDRKVARRTLEEFQAIGVAAVLDEIDDRPEHLADAYRRWVLDPDVAEDVAAVFGPPEQARVTPG